MWREGGEKGNGINAFIYCRKTNTPTYNQDSITPPPPPHVLVFYQHTKPPMKYSLE